MVCPEFWHLVHGMREQFRSWGVLDSQATVSRDSYSPTPCPAVGDALLDAGESMKRLAEVKDSLDIEVKQNFIDPLQNLCDKDLKEIQVLPPDLHPALPRMPILLWPPQHLSPATHRAQRASPPCADPSTCLIVPMPSLSCSTT